MYTFHIQTSVKKMETFCEIDFVPYEMRWFCITIFPFPHVYFNFMRSMFKARWVELTRFELIVLYKSGKLYRMPNFPIFSHSYLFLYQFLFLIFASPIKSSTSMHKIAVGIHYYFTIHWIHCIYFKYERKNRARIRNYHEKYVKENIFSKSAIQTSWYCFTNKCHQIMPLDKFC